MGSLQRCAWPRLSRASRAAIHPRLGRQAGHVRPVSPRLPRATTRLCRRIPSSTRFGMLATHTLRERSRHTRTARRLRCSSLAACRPIKDRFTHSLAPTLTALRSYFLASHGPAWAASRLASYHRAVYCRLRFHSSVPIHQTRIHRSSPLGARGACAWRSFSAPTHQPPRAVARRSRSPNASLTRSTFASRAHRQFRGRPDPELLQTRFGHPSDDCAHGGSGTASMRALNLAVQQNSISFGLRRGQAHRAEAVGQADSGQRP